MKQTLLVCGVSAVLAVLGAQAVWAGAAGGAKRWSAKVDAKAEVVYKITFRMKETAEFAIIGDGDTDVDVFVYDSANKLVAQDIGLSDLGLVRWTPDKTQEYRIVVRNLGTVFNRVHMGHN